MITPMYEPMYELMYAPKERNQWPTDTTMQAADRTIPSHESRMDCGLAVADTMATRGWACAQLHAPSTTHYTTLPHSIAAQE
jgi:hypothetical protein